MQWWAGEWIGEQVGRQEVPDRDETRFRLRPEGREVHRSRHGGLPEPGVRSPVLGDPDRSEGVQPDMEGNKLAVGSFPDYLTE